jgi:23S rRNA pseudouridine1911/1915/1917 synthase
MSATSLSIPLLFEDQDLAVVVKPSGVVVNNADTVSEPTLQDWWQEHLRKQSTENTQDWQKLVSSDFSDEYGSPENIFAERGGIVHRLDKETSGVMILAKNPGSLVNLLRQFRLREVQKKYVCLVHGKFQILEDVLQLPLSRSSLNRTKFQVQPTGRPAETQYQVQKTYTSLDAGQVVAALPSGAKTQPEFRNLRKKIMNTYQGFSLVYCWPKTGRTHQIRVHMSHIKHPIVSDLTYLGKKRSTLDTIWCPRLFLHAAELHVTHPRTGEKLSFTAELTEDLQKTLELLVE